MNQNLSRIIRHPATLSTLAGVTGFTIGYILGRRNRIIAHTIPVMEPWDDISTMEETQDEGVVVLITESVPHIEEELTSREIIDQVNQEMENREEVEIQMSGAGFAGTDMNAEWDYEAEIAQRDETVPYILHKDEFYSDERGFSQTTLTYYAGDDIMSDQDDKPVYNHENVTGPLRFGHGSDDPNIFYVRNAKMRAEYEIVFDTGQYSEIVLGLEIEQNDRAQNLKHSHTVQKFRPE